MLTPENWDVFILTINTRVASITFEELQPQISTPHFYGDTRIARLRKFLYNVEDVYNSSTVVSDALGHLLLSYADYCS